MKSAFALSSYETRSKFLKVTVLTGQNKKLHELKINLYRIMIGPSHHDFNIGQKDKSYGRLIFDIRIAEIILVKLNIR